MRQFLSIITLGIVLFSFGIEHSSAQSVSQNDSVRVSIFGDSYSTFYGYIPETHEPWYAPEGHPFFRADKNDVHKVEQTWWYLLVNELGWRIEQNNSYSGSTISYHGYRNECYKDRSFLTRMPYLGEPDVILLCGCTNDSWSNAQVGKYQYGNWEEADLFYFRPALAKLLSGLKANYPMARTYFILNSELRPEINESVHVICRHYGIPCIDLHDIEKQGGHPSQKGMRAMADQIKAVVK